MTPSYQLVSPNIERLFLFLDEWLFIALALYLVHRITAGMHYEREERWWKWAAVIAIPLGALFVYGIAYPMYYGWLRP